MYLLFLKHWKILAVTLAIFIIAGFSWLKGYGLAAAECREEKENARQEAQHLADKVSADYDKTITKLRATARNITHQMEAEIVKNPNPYSCIIPAGGLRILQQAIRSGNAR